MSLLITITRAPDSVALAESSKTFDANGGSIGRGKDNNWVLDDPERFLSSCHCRFSFENDQFFITDLSTNGTFLNGSPNPMGKGNRHALSDGDTFVLGDYEFTASLWNPVTAPRPEQEVAQPGPFSGAGTQATGDDIFASPSTFDDDFASNSIPSSPFSSGIVSQSDSLFGISHEETDPLKVLDKSQGNASTDIFSNSSSADPFQSQTDNDTFAAPSFSDQADPLNQQISWPGAVAEQQAASATIPDDWDDDLLSSTPSTTQEPTTALSAPAPDQSVVPLKQQPEITSPPHEALLNETCTTQKNQFQNTGRFDEHEGEVSPLQQKALEKANAKIQAELDILKQQMNAQQRGNKSDVSVDTTLTDSMGFEDRNLVDAEITQINQLAGEVVREMVSGLMQVLGSRSSIKNEFRMNVTTIQPVENNPLKFSANVDDALENMFLKQGNAYMKPVEAVNEGFSSIAEHQVAILAGIRAAFKGVIERFDPIVLEQRFSKQNKGGLIPGSQKARNWELYHDYFNELAGDIDNSFQYLFGDDFVSAYEDQLQKLAIARKSAQTKREA